MSERRQSVTPCAIQRAPLERTFDDGFSFETDVGGVFGRTSLG